MTQAADLTERDEAAGRTVALSGNLSLAHIGDLPQRLSALGGGVKTVDLSAVDHLDTIGAWVVHRFSQETGATITGAAPDAERLLDVVSRNDMPCSTRSAWPCASPSRRWSDWSAFWA